MTNERRDEIIIIALVVSVAIHIGLMLFAKPRVMTQVSSSVQRAVRREPMNVSSADSQPPPESIADILDLKALKDAPEARSPERIVTPVPEFETPKAALAVNAPEETARELNPKDPPPAEFAAAPIKLDDVVTEKISVSGFGSPVPVKVLQAPSAGDLGISVKSAPAVQAQLPAPPPIEPAATARIEPVMEKAEEPKPAFVPEKEVFEKVDERIVEAEKQAVRKLVDATDASELVKFVNTAMVSTQADGWTYFKVMIMPRNDLPVVPKDIVILIDASGSIGKDRIGSIRSAAKKILRSATNSGDRFNFVAFRDRFAYAFRTWQTCTQQSFDASDKWLNALAAHGRTDVFSTISSVLTLPRDPSRPLIALVVTDGDANSGVKNNAEIISRFTALNDGLVSVYMYGVKESANRELIDVLTHGNRGESFIYDGWRWSAGSGIEGLTTRFRDPVLSDLRIVFPTASQAESYPERLRNLYRGEVLEIFGRVRSGANGISFSLKGLNGKNAYEGFFTLPVGVTQNDKSIVAGWQAERAINQKLR